MIRSQFLLAAFPHPRICANDSHFSYSYEEHSPCHYQRSEEQDLAALNIDWSFLDRGRVEGTHRGQSRRWRCPFAQYQQTVLLAVEDVDDALVRYARSREQDAQLQQAAVAADLANLRYREGATGLLDLLDAQRVELRAEALSLRSEPFTWSTHFGGQSSCPVIPL